MPAVEAFKDVNKQLVDDIHDLIIVFIDGHLKIKPSELAQVAVGERILRPGKKNESSASGTKQGNVQKVCSLCLA